MNVEERLARLGLQLPSPPRPLGNYKAAVIAGGLLFLSGQLPIREGKLIYTGRVGAELSEDEGRDAARLAALNVLAQIRIALGGFDSLVTLLRVDGYISSAPDWFNQPRIVDAASDLFSEVLQEKAGHARSAFAAQRIPMNAAVNLVVVAAVRLTSPAEQHITRVDL